MVLVPMYGLINGWGEGESSVDQFKWIWATQIRYAGVGAMVVGGLYTLLVNEKEHYTGISKALKPIQVITKICSEQKLICQ